MVCNEISEAIQNEQFNLYCSDKIQVLKDTVLCKMYSTCTSVRIEESGHRLNDPGNLPGWL